MVEVLPIAAWKLRAAIVSIGIVILVHLEIQGIRLHGPAARETPGGRDHLLDDGEFDVVAGLKTENEFFGEYLEGIGTFIAQQHDLCEEAVLDGVLGRLGFAGRGLGPARFGSVDARGFGFGQGHGYSW